MGRLQIFKQNCALASSVNEISFRIALSRGASLYFRAESCFGVKRPRPETAQFFRLLARSRARSLLRAGAMAAMCLAGLRFCRLPQPEPSQPASCPCPSPMQSERLLEPGNQNEQGANAWRVDTEGARGYSPFAGLYRFHIATLGMKKKFRVPAAAQHVQDSSISRCCSNKSQSQHKQSQGE